MKKIFAILLSLTVLGSTTLCANAGTMQHNIHHPSLSGAMERGGEETLGGLVINGEMVDTSKLPKAFYKEGDTVMVPASVICDRLAYRYRWDAESGTLTIEDSIQKAILVKGRKDVEFIGKLKIIDLDGIFEFGSAMAVVEDVVYVPVELFCSFFNKVTIMEDSVLISEVVCHTVDKEEKTEKADGYRLIVNGAPVNTENLPYAAYEKEGVIMLPLRIIAEALGYKIDWIPATKDIIMEDSIQKVVLHDGSATAHFTGKLTNINLSGAIELEAAVMVHDGNTYVPASLFELFFNEVNVKDMVISVSLGMCELHKTVQ